MKTKRKDWRDGFQRGINAGGLKSAGLPKKLDINQLVQQLQSQRMPANPAIEALAAEEVPFREPSRPMFKEEDTNPLQAFWRMMDVDNTDMLDPAELDPLQQTQVEDYAHTMQDAQLSQDRLLTDAVGPEQRPLPMFEDDNEAIEKVLNTMRVGKYYDESDPELISMAEEEFGTPIYYDGRRRRRLGPNTKGVRVIPKDEGMDDD